LGLFIYIQHSLGKIKCRFLNELLEGDAFMPILNWLNRNEAIAQVQHVPYRLLDLDSARSEWTDLELSRWLDKRLKQPDIYQQVLKDCF
tara:strand:+ start:75 stop:341 length:267 start_codon:yes stop_codon:yes gene_type:complete